MPRADNLLSWNIWGLPRFQYEPLPNPATYIRLLEVLPDSPSTTIKCRLKIVDRDAAAGTYEPLSYCWGPQDSQTTIFINDAISSVGPNLHAALLNLRRKKGEAPRLLWVDALCINQADLAEKSVQVQMMRPVYQDGLRTLIWLGEEEQNTTPLAFKMLRFLADYGEAHPGEQINLKDWKKHRRLEKGESEYKLWGAGWLWSAISESQARDALDALVGREWFTRVWIIQEVAVSKNAIVICGKHEIPWDSIQNAYDVARDSWQYANLLVTLIEEREKYQRGVVETMAAKAWAMCRSKATDPRDKIYGLLGLLLTDPAAPDIPIVVDYETSPGEVFRNITRQYLERTNDVGMLAVGIGCRVQEALGPAPSWSWRLVTDTNDPDAWDMFAWDPTGANDCHFKATGTSTTKLEFSDDSKMLAVSGYELDQVQELGPPLDPFENEMMAFDHFWPNVAWVYLQWRRLAGLHVEGTRYRDTEEPIEEAYRQVIQPIDANPPPEDELRAIFKRYDAMVIKNFAFLNEKETMDTVDWARCQPKLLQLAYKHKFNAGDAKVVDEVPKIIGGENKRLVKTSTGYIGLAPRQTEAGDRVFLLEGSRAPFILRQIPGDRWRLVGDAKIHGVMYGEAWDATKCQKLWIE